MRDHTAEIQYTTLQHLRDNGGTTQPSQFTFSAGAQEKKIPFMGIIS
jgi:hypothetical protein